MLDPEISLGRLIINIGRIQAMRADRMMERIHLHRGQAILLIILSEKNGLTHSEICEKLEISPSAATKVIKRMEAQNYLQRQGDPLDERLSRVYLKDDGWKVISQIKQCFDQLDEVLWSTFSEQEQSTLLSLLQRVQGNLLSGIEDTPLPE